MSSPMIEPVISVVMAVYNGEKYLEQSIKSILCQTFNNFEFIIVNDGSTDGTADILNQFMKEDRRIKIYSQPNQGLISALNKGCSLAKGRYIARMDADDISIPDRFKMQMAYMEKHPDIGILGGWIQDIDVNGTPIGIYQTPETPGLVGWYLFSRNCMVHPTILMRTDILKELNFYSPQAKHAEDYNLWCRAFFVTRIGNIPEIMIHRRVWGGSICSLYSEDQKRMAAEIMQTLISQYLKSNVPLKTVADLQKVCNGQRLQNVNEVDSVYNLLMKLYHSYITQAKLTPVEMSEVIHDVADKIFTLFVSCLNFSIRRSLFFVIKSMIFDSSVSIKRIKDFTEKKKISLMKCWGVKKEGNFY